MEFSDFAHILFAFVGDDLNTADFACCLLLSVTADEIKPFIKSISPNTYKSYFNGQRQLTRISKEIIAHLDLDKFADFIKSQEPWCKEEICNAIDKINLSYDIDLMNCHIVCANIFHDIIASSRLAKRRSPGTKQK